METNKLKSADLCIPIYLNQRIVFDILAIIEDGFSQLSAIKASTSEAETQKSGMGASIGMSNVFALLGVSFKKEKEAERGTEAQTEISKEKVHTPASLFSKLRSQLKQQQLLAAIPTKESSIDDIKSGQFIEFRAVLRKNPLVDTFEGFRQLMDIAVLFPDEQSTPAKSKQAKGGRHRDQNKEILQWLNGMLQALTESNTMELIAEIMDTSTVKAVLSTELDYFSDRTVSEIIDGEFQVLGKVVRVVKPNSRETINLLRKTSFGRLQQNIFDDLANTFEGAEQEGISIPELITEIKGPALQVLPIAIYV